MDIPSYLKDTNSFLRAVEDINWRGDLKLVSIDVESLYTRIPHHEGVNAICLVLHRAGKSPAFIDFVREALLFILTHNSFLFNNQWFNQVTGTAMGTPVACTFANIFLAVFESKFILNLGNPYVKYIHTYLRYIDDVFMAWSGSEQEFFDFVDFLNTGERMNMRFPCNFGDKHLEFLDVQLDVVADQIKVSGYRKPTATNALLHYNSAHPDHVKKAVPYGQFVRLRRINDSDESFHKQALELKDRLRLRGYPDTIIKTAYDKATKLDRHQLLHRREVKRNSDRFTFTFDFCPNERNIRKAIQRNWVILERDPELRKVTVNRPMISFKRNPTMRDLLVNSKFSDKKTTWLDREIPKGNFTCHHCNFCRFHLRTRSLNIGGVTTMVEQFISCKTDYVVYVIFCTCRRFYIGKTIRPLYIRFREHHHSITSGKGSQRLIKHIRDAHAGDPNSLTFAGIERVMPKIDGGDRHRELLRREARWILKTEAEGPIGLNDKNDMAVFI
ncbi:uncharacterized protein [Engystomops pustulosus]|uniref:uncharacterized protein isoform X1 n=1 Tax=Engystomops pustulosus TaxID=76066 RepID=UPI003AFAB372